MITVYILWILLLGAISGLLFLLSLPFVMVGMIIYTATPKKWLINLICNVKDFNLPFVRAYLKGKKK